MIEGSEDAIDGLVERLRQDPRHSAFEVRDERFVDSRPFPDWSMKLVRLNAGEGDVGARMATGLPEEMSPAIRDLILRMVCGLSGAPWASGRVDGPVSRPR
ncbi:MAG: BLUF domain-containing protein [Sphingosinicella sp.]|nr:BLUF domain-containing protein [Sphingosinicella sp.]